MTHSTNRCKTEITWSFLCKLLEEKVWEIVEDIYIGKHLLGRTPTAQKGRPTVDKWVPMMLKSLHMAKETELGAERIHRIGQKSC